MFCFFEIFENLGSFFLLGPDLQIFARHCQLRLDDDKRGSKNRRLRLISLVGLVFHSQPSESHPHPSHPWHFSDTSHCDWNSFCSSVFFMSPCMCVYCVENKQVKLCDVNGGGVFFSVWCNRVHTSPCAMVESRVWQSRLKHFFSHCFGEDPATKGVRFLYAGCF